MPASVPILSRLAAAPAAIPSAPKVIPPPTSLARAMTMGPTNPLVVLVAGGGVKRSQLTLDQETRRWIQEKLVLQSGLTDGTNWNVQTMNHSTGVGVSRLSTNESGPVEAVSVASFDAMSLVPETVRTRESALDSILRQFFTERELNEENLGQYRHALNKTKFYSRIAGLLSLKAAIFRSAGLPLPGESSDGKHLDWTDVEYVREPYTNIEGQTRYRRVRNFHGEIATALAEKELLTNFTDEGDVGMAIAVVVREPGQSGIISLGLDITNRERFAAPEEAMAHTRGEAAYKATYFGGHQSYYLDNVIGDVHASETVGDGRVSYTLDGPTGEAMQRLGGQKVVGTTVQDTPLVGTLMVVQGTLPAGQVSLGNIAAPPETKPLLAQLIEEGKVNVILQYPGQAGEFIAYLLDKFNNDPEARKLILQRAAELRQKFAIDFQSMIQGSTTPSEIAASPISQPLIGLAQEVAAMELARLGYDFRRSPVVAIGHSQGQILSLHTLGAVTGADVSHALGLNGRVMQEADPYFHPQVGDSLDLADFAGIGSEQQLEKMLAYTGKISMIATAGVSRNDLAEIVKAVSTDADKRYDFAKISLVNVESDPGRYEAILNRPGVKLPDNASINSIMVSGTTDALKEVARRVMAGGAGRKVRVAPVTAAFHSEMMEEGFKTVLPSLVGKRLADLPTAVLLNHTGEDLRGITGTAIVAGPNGEKLAIDAQVYAVMRGQYLDPVEWPTVVYKAFAMGDPGKPTVVIDGGPGKLTANLTSSLLTDRAGRSLATVISLGTPEGMSILQTIDPDAIRLVDPRTWTDPDFKPVLPQPDKGPPVVDGEYTGPHGYLSDIHLADPGERRDLIRRLERVLNLDEEGDPHFHSEFFKRLGYDQTMPLNVAAMTGNNRVELVSSMAADHYLCFYAVTTVGFDFAALAAELDSIHERTKERLKEKEVADWEKGAPFGANLIHGTGSYKRQIQEIIAAKKRGVPINVVSVAFSKIELAEWNEFYKPLLDEGITIVPLGENENRWDHFLNNIFPDVPEHQRHLLAIAPEGGEGGGHNVSEKSEAIRYGRDLTHSLLERGGLKNADAGIEVPWLMTGGESTPQALADALLVMADQKVRGGMQIGGAMQIALESAPPPQVKAFIAEAMAGNGRFEQVDSEFDRRINLVGNEFSRRLVEISDIVADVPAADTDIEIRDLSQVPADVQAARRVQIFEIAKGTGTTDEKIAAIRKLWDEMQKDPKKTTRVKVQASIGADRAKKIAGIMLQEPLPMRRVLHRMWIEGLNDYNFAEFAPLLSDGWDLWLAGDAASLAAKLATLTRTAIIRLFRSYRTWAINEPDCDPQGAYVLGGKSIRAMGRSLEAEGCNPGVYLMKPAPEIFRDLRDRTLKYLKDLYARATALEEAEQDKYAVTDVDEMKAIRGVSVVSEKPLAEGKNATVRFKLEDGFDAGPWEKALLSAGHGSLARVLRTEEVGGGEKENPLHRTLIAAPGDQVELVRRLEAGRVLLEGVRIFDKSKRLVVEIKPSDDHTAVEETWHLEQRQGEPSPVTWRYEIQTGIVGNKKAVLVPGETAKQGREAYTKRWIGADVKPAGALGNPVTTEPFEVTAEDVLRWNKQAGAKSRPYTDQRQAGGVKVHPTYPLQAAWRSMMLAGMHPHADVDYLKVIHSGQTQRLGAPVKIGDRLTATSKIIRIENNPLIQGQRANGREVTIFTAVVNQDGETVAEYRTRFLSRVSGLKTSVVFDQEVQSTLAPETPLLSVEPLEVYRREGISLSLREITGYATDDQWLHTDPRFARRVGFKNGIIAQGWKILHAISHSIAEGYLDDSSRFIGFGEGTAVTGAVLPGEKMILEVDRIGIRGDREVLSFRLVPEEGGQSKASGTIELKTPQYAAEFPGNASQSVGMAKVLYEQDGVGRKTLEEAVAALDEGGNLLLDVITDGASVPEGDTERRTAFEKAKREGWLNDVENSSPAVLATSIAYYRARIAAGFPKPTVVTGHSLGQYTAAVAAGAVNLKDAMPAARFRGRLMKRYAQGKIAALTRRSMIDIEALNRELAKICQGNEVLEVANVNVITQGYSQVVISGHEAAIKRAKEVLAQRGEGRVDILPANIAFHCSLLRLMEAGFRDAVASVQISDPEVPIASIVTPGKMLRTADDVREELVILNHSPVEWDANVRAIQNSGINRFVEFGSGSTLTNFVTRIVPDGIAAGISQVAHVDEALFGKRPEPPVEETAPPPPSPQETMLPKRTEVVGAIEPPPPAYSSVDMQVLDLRLTSARVVLDKGVIVSATLSPLAPPLGASVSEFVWANMILTLCETFPGKIKPAEITPQSKLLGEIGFDSLELALYFGLVRNRNGIARMPTDDEVKALEGGTMADAFKLIVSYWDHPGDKPDISKIAPPLGTPGKTYKEILDAAGVKGDPVFKLIADQKLTPRTGGLLQKLLPILGEASEGAAAGVADHLARVKGWKYSENFTTQAMNLRAVREKAYLLAVPLWEQKKKGREARNRATQAAAGVGAMAAAVDPEEVRQLAAEAAAQIVRNFVRTQGPLTGGGSAVVRTLEEVGDTVAAEKARKLAAVVAETSDRFVKMLSTTWSGRLHPAWGEVEQNGAPGNLLALFTEIAEGELDPDSEFGKARIRLLANQADKLRVDLALQLADLAAKSGLDKVEKALRQVAEEGVRSIAEGGLAQPIVWESTRMVADPTAPGGVREVSRGMTPSQVLDQWKKEQLVDPKTIADLRALIKGEVSYKGKKVLVYGGTGTISRPTVEFFMELGAEVWVTTRQNFGEAEKWAREIRNKHGVRGNSLRVSTGFEPNYSNIAALRAQHEEQQWKPDIIINGMAADDYGPITEKLDFHKVAHVLVDSFRYAVGQYIDRYKKESDQSPTLTVVDQDSPNNNFAIKFSGSYPFAKAAMPSGQWAHRRETEGLKHPDGRPIYREAAIVTGAVVPPSSRGIMGEFRKKGDAIEAAARAEQRPLWIFNGPDMGAVNVAICNPVHGNSDQNDRLADGGFGKMSDRPGGLQGLMDEVAAKPATAAPEAKPAEALPYHPFVDGQFRPPTSFGFYIDETDGSSGVANPYSEIADDDLVIVGADMATTFGPDAISSFVNLLETVGGFKGPWGQYLGLLWTAKLMGLDVTGKTPSEVQQLFGSEIYANMGPRQLEADNGQRADAYKQLQLYEGPDKISLATWEEFQAAREGTDDAHQQLRKRVADLGRTGYTFDVERIWDNDAPIPGWKEVVIARKPNATQAREVVIQIGPQIVADLPPIDWAMAGAGQPLIDSRARHIMAGQMVASGAARQTGLVPHDLTARHGAEQVYTVDSHGMGGLNIIRAQQQNPREGKDPGKNAVVYGIPAAGAGRIGQDIFGAKGPCTDTPGACNTGPTSIWHAKQYFEAASERARRAREKATEEQNPVQRMVLEMEAKRLEEFAEDMVVVVVSGDNGATVETNMLFEHIGAMLTRKKAAEKEFPDAVQQRPHDKDRIPGFQSGVGFGSLIVVRGKSMKKHGYTPLAVLRGTDIGSDGPLQEPDEKTRAPTGLGKWGQRKVFFRGLREARMNGLLPQFIEQMNSHSTGTGGDPAQSESFFVAKVGEAVDWAVKVIAAGGGATHYPKFAARIAAREVNVPNLAKSKDWEATLKQIGLSVDKPEVMMQEVAGWSLEEREELGITALQFENHPKGAGFRHTLGGTMIEFVSLLMQTTERLTLPHPGLNNIIDSTGRSPVATTLPQVTDLKPVFGRGANYQTTPDQAPRKRRGMAQNSFGFNGLDGYVVAEVPEGRHFSTVAEAKAWFFNNIRTYARAVALYRARNDGKLPAILPYEVQMEHPELLYPDTKEAYEKAAAYAAKIVAREEVEFPWEKLRKENIQKTAGSKAA